MSEYLSGLLSTDDKSAIGIEKLIIKAEEDVTKLDGHLEYTHYSVMFDSPSSSVRALAYLLIKDILRSIDRSM